MDSGAGPGCPCLQEVGESPRCASLFGNREQLPVVLVFRRWGSLAGARPCSGIGSSSRSSLFSGGGGVSPVRVLVRESGAAPGRPCFQEVGESRRCASLFGNRKQLPVV